MGMTGAAIGQAVNIGAQVAGAIGKGVANKKIKKSLNEDIRNEENSYQDAMNSDYTQRTDFLNILNAQRDVMNQQMQAAKADSIVSGGSDEALAMQKEGINNAMATTMSQQAAQASAYKDSLRSEHMATMRDFNSQQRALYEKQGENVAQAASQIGKSAAALGKMF